MARLRQWAPRIAAGAFPLALVAAVGAAWLAQSAVHVSTGRLPPPREAYDLLGALGVEWLRVLAPPDVHNNVSLAPGALLLYAAAAVVFVCCALCVRRPAGERPAGQRPFHLEADPPAPPREPRTRRQRLAWGLGTAAFLVLAAFALAFTLASARANVFPTPTENLPRADQWAKLFHARLGLDARPNWWLPGLSWIGWPMALVGAVWTGGNARGWRWRAPVPDAWRIRRALWEWPAVAVIAFVSTASAMQNLDTAPYVLQQDEGLVGRGGYYLTREGSTENIFHDPIQPYPGFLTRGLASRFAGNRHEPLRLVSALTAGVGVVVMYLTLRIFAGGLAAVLATALLASTHLLVHYARLGINNIDSMHWVFLMLLCFFRAEAAAPGPRRWGLAIVAGAVCGVSFGMYTGTLLGAAAVLGMALVRAMGAPSFGKTRAVPYALLAGTMLLMALPFRINPQPGFNRGDMIHLLSAAQLKHELNPQRPDGLRFAKVEDLVAHHWRNALGAFHYRRDNSHDFSTPFPLLGPLGGALSALGLALLLVRFRSWASIYAWGLVLSGTLLGGALRHSPYAPSSARLMMIVAAVAVPMAVALDVVVHAIARALAPALEHRRAWARAGGAAVLGLAATAGAWTLASEARLNARLYDRFHSDRQLLFHQWMGHSTEIQRFLLARPGIPDVIVQFDVDLYANQSFMHNDYYLPGREGRRFWVERGQAMNPRWIPETGRVLFIVNVQREGELDAIRAAWPGGQTFRSQPLPFPGATSRYHFYEVWRGWPR